MKRKPNPPHPGEVLRQYLDGIPVTEVARILGVNRTTISRILSGVSGISPDMSVRLGQALGTEPEFWAGLQLKFDLHQALKLKRPKIRLIATQMKDRSVTEMKGMFAPPAGLRVSVEDMRVTMPADMAAWEAAPPVGREFGSPDYERLEKLDALALKALGSIRKVRKWLDAPHPELGGLTPEASARTVAGYRQAMRLLENMCKARKQAKTTGD